MNTNETIVIESPSNDRLPTAAAINQARAANANPDFEIRGLARVGTDNQHEAGVVDLKAPDGLNARVTRFGLLPIRNIPVDAQAFNVWHIPANEFFPFRGFVNELKNSNGDVYATVPRTPLEQLVDMQTIAAGRNFVDFPEIAKLENEENARRVFMVLSLPRLCSKYGYDLKNQCLTCWIAYLESDEFRIKVYSEFQGEAEYNLRTVALDAAGKLITNFLEALQTARQEIDTAIRQVEDKTSGKDTFYAIDYLHVYHTHSERPQYKTTTQGVPADIGSQIGAAIAPFLQQRQPQPAAPQPPAAPAFTLDDISRMIGEAVSQATQPLTDEIERLRKQTGVENASQTEPVDDEAIVIEDKPKPKGNRRNGS